MSGAQTPAPDGNERVKPVTLKTGFGWWAGTTEEFMNIAGPLDTREEAIAEGRANQCGDPFYICNASLYEWTAPDASDVIDRHIECHEDLWLDDGFSGFDGPKALEMAAQDDLQAVLNAWFLRYKAMFPIATAFAGMSGGEWFDELAKEPESFTPDYTDAILEEARKGTGR